MEKWSVACPEVSFLCLCCAGSGLAEEFGTVNKLANCHHGVITDGGPRWGQLGCNGFIVFDADLNVVNPCTSAYLEVKEQAFRNLEGVLASVLGQPLLRGGSAVSTPPQPAAVETGCAGGRCSLPIASKASRGAGGAGAKVTKAIQVASVGNAEMDDEHELCAAALAALQDQPSAGTLAVVFDVISDHFAHEEELLDTHIYTARAMGGGGFSALENMRRSHYRDHQRILDSIAEPLAAVQAGKLAGVDEDLVTRVIESFEKHADLYDGGYAVDLAAALAR